MTLEFVGDVPGNPAALPEEIAEFLELLRKTLVALPSQPDIEVVAFAEAPAISLEIPAEIKFRRIRADAAVGDLFRIHLEFDFLRRHCGFGCAELRAQETGHRAEMPSRADGQRGRDGVVDQPLAAAFRERFQRLADRKSTRLNSSHT